MRILVLLLLALPGCWEPVPAGKGAPPRTHVLLISLDGLRPDAIDKAHTPNLDYLIENGAYCPVATTVSPSVTMPSHASMVTGLTPERHGALYNEYQKGNLAHPTIFSIAGQAGLSTAMMFAKAKLRYLGPERMDWVFGARPDRSGPKSDARSLAAAFAKKWEGTRFDLTFIHFRETDIAGHVRGWMSKSYFNALEQEDEALGVILDALRKTGTLDRATLIVTSDHGGRGRAHGSRHPLDMTIPWICMGPGVEKGMRIERTVRTLDTAPTVLRLLGLEIPDGLDGRRVEEVAR